MRRGFLAILFSSIALAPLGCGEPAPSDAPAASASAPAGKPVDPATAGTIAGRAVFDGAAPAPRPLDTGMDPNCAGESGGPILDRTIVVTGGGLENVFVRITGGLEGYGFPAPAEPAKLDQQGCVYTPRVLGVRVGQPLEVSNSDPLLHNVHALPKVNRPFNTAQPIEGMRHTHTFAKPEVMVPLKCDVHPWMIAYVGVVEHPYFAVTGSGGSFELRNVPPGTYTIEAWHEKLGTRTATVTVEEKGTAAVEFQYGQS